MRAFLGLLLVLPVLLLGPLAVPAEELAIGKARVVSGLSQPVGMVAAPGITDRVFVIEQRSGRIRVVSLTTSAILGDLMTVPGIHTGGGEQGLLGIAFDPQFLTNGFFYVDYTGGPGSGSTFVDRFHATLPPGAVSYGSATTADPATRANVLTIAQPEGNHNGGWIGFGSETPTPCLYIATGDGGGADDRHGSIGNAQDRTSLLGKILRIGVASLPYTIPTGNPFVGNASGWADEILCFGLRNPWRGSIDRATGDLWIGDVGQNHREEVDRVPFGTTGQNFGWRPREGFIQNPSFAGESPVTTATGPVDDYDRGTGVAITGGYRYRGSAIPELAGRYLFADYATGLIRAISLSDSGTVATRVDLDATLAANGPGTIGNISAFGEDAAGELYLCDHSNGILWKIVSTVVPVAPVITSTPATIAQVTVPYVYDVVASGAPAPTYRLDTAPPGMAITATSGRISWTPTAEGTATVAVVASNGTAPDATQRFVITVAGPIVGGRPPASPYLGMPSDDVGGAPTSLADTGAFSDLGSLTPATALIPYEVIHPFWSDGAVKRRWLSVPSAATVGFSPDGAWIFPAGTVFVKHFTVVPDARTPAVSKRIETRLLVRRASGGVYGVTYRWNDAGTAATKVTSTTSTELVFHDASGASRLQTWTYPSPTDCLSCHTPTGGGVLGVQARQLNRRHTYPTGVEAHQLDVWDNLGLFSAPLSNAERAAIPTLVDLGDSGAPLATRVRSYLDVNCAQCHRPGGPTAATFDARITTPLGNQGLINGAPLDNLGIGDARIIAPKNRDRSVLYQRILGTDPAVRMPPLGRHTVDAQAADTVGAWIDTLESTSADDGGSSCGIGGIGAILAGSLLLIRLGLRGGAGRGATRRR